MRYYLICLASLLLIAGQARAQSRTGSAEGTIYDDQGMPMVGANIALSSPTQIGGTLKTVTGADGSFRFIGLIPGNFTVKVTKPGFLTDMRKGIRIHANKTITLDILLDRAPTPPPKAGPPPKPGEEPLTKVPDIEVPEGVAAAEAETYVITARPVIDVTSSTAGECVSDEFMESVPMRARDYQGVAAMTRNVTGGANPNVSGGAYFNNTYTVDGMETTDPVTHTFGTNFNFDAMSDVSTMTGGMGAEFADTPGGVVNMVTKSGSNKFELDTSLYYQPNAFVLKDEEEEGSTFEALDFNLNISGPIIKDKLWYYTSWELNRNTSSIPPDERLAFPSDDPEGCDPGLNPILGGCLPDHPSRTYWGGKAFVKLTYQLNPKHRLVWWAQGDPASISNTRQAITVLPEAEMHQNQFGALSTLAWEWFAKENVFVKTQLGFGLTGLRIYPESGDEDTPGHSNIDSGVGSENYSYASADDRYRLSLHSDATWFLDKLGRHEIKGGFRYHYMFNPSTDKYSGNEYYLDAIGVDADGNPVVDPYARYTYYTEFDMDTGCDENDPNYDPAKCSQGTLKRTVKGNKLIMFLQDKWRIPGYERLTLTPGAAFHFGNTINPEGLTITNFTTGTAHFNWAWDLLNDGKTVIRGGYNQYVDVGFLSMASFIGKDLVSYRCNWDPATSTFSQYCRAGGQTRTVGRPMGPDYDEEGNAINLTNPDNLTIPRVHEFTFGAEREWLTGFSTGLDFQYRHYGNQWEDLETNVIWNEVGDDYIGFKNGIPQYIYDLETPAQAYRRYFSMSLFARKFVGNWQIMGSYTLSRSDGTSDEGFATTYLDRPMQAMYYDSYLPTDRRHQIKLNGWYRFYDIVTIGGDLWVGSGVPYNKYFYNAFYGDYSEFRAKRGYDPGDLTTTEDDKELRMPTRMAFDIKLTLHLKKMSKWIIGEPLNLELMAELFNAFNLREVTAYEERFLTDPNAPKQWGDVVNKQSPLRARMAIRYRY